MIRKMKKWMAPFLSTILVFSLGANVMADDHENGDSHEKSEFFEKSGDDEHENEGKTDEYDPDENNQASATNQPSQIDYWNIWSRKPVNNLNNPLPITTPTDLSVSINGKSAKLYFIPREGQMLVSGEAVAAVLGAKAKFYPQSKIMIISKNKLELIVRADSNAVYENQVKNPMPVKASAYEKTIYLPVSVAANAFGYRISWNKTKNTILFSPI